MTIHCSNFRLISIVVSFLSLVGFSWCFPGKLSFQAYIISHIPSHTTKNLSPLISIFPLTFRMLAYLFVSLHRPCFYLRFHIISRSLLSLNYPCSIRTGIISNTQYIFPQGYRWSGKVQNTDKKPLQKCPGICQNITSFQIDRQT